MRTCLLFLETLVLLLWELLTNKNLNRLTQEVGSESTEYSDLSQLNSTKDLEASNLPTATIVAVEFQKEIYPTELRPNLGVI